VIAAIPNIPRLLRHLVQRLAGIAPFEAHEYGHQLTAQCGDIHFRLFARYADQKQEDLAQLANLGAELGEFALLLLGKSSSRARSSSEWMRAVEQRRRRPLFIDALKLNDVGGLRGRFRHR